VLAIFWGLWFFGLTDLLVFLQGPEFHADFHLETGWGLFFLVMVAVPLAAIAVAPRSVLPAAVQQVLLAAVAVAIGAALSASPKHLLPAAGLAATALVVASLSGSVRVALPTARRWSWPLGSLVIVAAVPWFGYALAAAEDARAGHHV
jgi:hypothetical protein